MRIGKTNQRTIDNSPIPIHNAGVVEDSVFVLWSFVLRLMSYVLLLTSFPYVLRPTSYF